MLLNDTVAYIPIESEGKEEDNGRILRVVFPIGEGLEVLDQLHHRIVVLDLSAISG